ncbi:PIN-like domain-containing protein [uncultured Chryseobacterium sp.]|uniref:PIN-like domain-containing protein n=1 Tax=uncultured Chryseobacterium sp. TaxID=259322 RepID=UPI0025D4967D|nr:PIN-like domain-containing protein [uncultured Chryseobacterium sp.]
MIDESLSYYNKIDKYSISTYKEVTKLFSENFEDAIKLKLDIPIFLDTNILLRYYSISFTARNKLFNFLESKKDNIYITGQVQKEFLKNREDIINRYFEQVSKKVPKEFDNEILNKLQNFIEQHKIILKDYPYVERGIEKNKKNLEEIFQKLNKDTEEKYKQFKNLIWEDKFLDLLSELKLSDNLDNNELKLIKSHFDEMRKLIKDNNIDSYLNKSNFVFPGMCDIKEKPDNPYGDYIIFHEVMKFMLKNNSNAIFLTFDNTKGDWMSKNKSTHLHYVHNIYLNTKKILYIVDAERTLKNLLDVNIDSLLINENSNNSITIDMIEKIFNEHEIFEEVTYSKPTKKLIKELVINNYTNPDHIIDKLDKIEPIIDIIKKDNPRLNTQGILRYALRIADPNYTKFFQNGQITEVSKSFTKFFEKYRLLI